ncbi:MAG: TonB-dependent hemoglobin/transferrin/lactoferrin family receptor [Gammaproteobacteria bacterium]|nr:TonB-dependent hemoglobin/transferrin/lactoferrin family receptor [Gammaproteobacteria bacterium]
MSPATPVLGAACALALWSAAAPAAETPKPAQRLNKITVSATRAPRQVSEVTGSVDVVEREQLEAELARDIKDAVRYLPGLSVRDNAGRFGLSDIGIRGLDGNRVLIEVDGVRVADAFAIGSFTSAGRNAVDLDMLQSLEVVRGAASSLYGSQAIAGVVSFRTKDPEDLLQGRAQYLGAKLAGYSADGERVLALTGAAGGEQFSGLVHAVGRRGHEGDNQGGKTSRDNTRTALNPQDTEHQALLTKLLWQPDEALRLRLTLDRDEGRSDTELYSARGPSRLGASTVMVQDLDGEDEQRRERVQLDGEWAPALAWLDSAEAQLFRQDSETVQETFERRETRTPIPGQGERITPAERYRRADLDQESRGLKLKFQSQFAGQQLVYGLERVESEQAERRDGFQKNLLTGAVSTMVPPDAFPVRDYPLSTLTETGAYVQDEIALGGFRLVPGLRWDRTELDARLDPIFAGDNPDHVPADRAVQQLSPKLGALWALSPDLSLFGQWATGFRAPPYQDVNIGFTNLQFGYQAIPNPDLEPERSENRELGLRGTPKGGYWELAVFDNRYRDFIESLAVAHIDPQTRVTTYQAQNLHRARIYGAELRLGWDLDAAWGWEGWQLRGAASYSRGESWARGENRENGQPLNSVDPAKLVLGLGWEQADGVLGLELAATAVVRKTHVDDSAGERFRSPGYASFDLLGHWSLADNTELRLGLYNLADKTYWDWADVRGVAADSPILDRYTRPGRNAALSLNVHF